MLVHSTCRKPSVSAHHCTSCPLACGVGHHTELGVHAGFPPRHRPECPASLPELPHGRPDSLSSGLLRPPPLQAASLHCPHIQGTVIICPCSCMQGMLISYLFTLFACESYDDQLPLCNFPTYKVWPSACSCPQPGRGVPLTAMLNQPSTAMTVALRRLQSCCSCLPHVSASKYEYAALSW